MKDFLVGGGGNVEPYLNFFIKREANYIFLKAIKCVLNVIIL